MRLLFYPLQSGKLWDGNTLKTEALGGSETAVASMAKELAKLGHEVVVFTRKTPSVIDGVVYLDWYKARAILRTLDCDALICARDMLPLLWQHQAKQTAVWLHDLPQGAYQLPDATYYFCVSAWQAGVWVGHGIIPSERVKITYNGIDHSLFPKEIKKPQLFNKHSTIRLAWTSNPDRGLWHAGEILQRIRKDFPNAELHVFGRSSVYGWNNSYEHNYFPSDMTNVILHPSLPKKKLYDELVDMDLWLYPTWWAETYCIAAVEAQMAGVPVVASQYGALTETCQSGLLIPGNMNDEKLKKDHLDEMTSEIFRLLKNPTERSKMQEKGLAYAKTQGWQQHAVNWTSLLGRGVGIQ